MAETSDNFGEQNVKDLPKSNIINPYELLNVTTNSTLQEVKKSYYELAKIMHPDRSGGRKEDMEMLHSCYQFIKRELEQTNTNITFEDLESQFRNFLTTQEKQIPKFCDIYDDAFDVDKFNEKFLHERVNEKNNPFSLDGGGYGEDMEESEYIEDKSIFQRVKDFFSGFKASNEPKVSVKALEDARYNDSQEKVMQPLKNKFDVQTWSNPISNVGGGDYLDYTNQDRDYTGGGMTDYKVAYTNQVSPENWNQDPKMESIDSLVERRKKEEESYPGAMLEDVKWAHDGICDASGNKIQDWKKLIHE